MFVKNLMKVVAALLLVALFLAPVGALYWISQWEQGEYIQDIVPEGELKEKAYGTPVQVARSDVEEVITLSGTVVSTRVIYQELEQKVAAKLRLLVSAGEVLQVGDVIGYCDGKEVLATESGIVRSVHLEGDAYIELWSLDDLAIECYVNDTILKVLKRGSLKLSDSEGNAYSVSRVDDIRVGSDLTRVQLTSETASLIYGKSMSAMTFHTGRVYTGSLVVSKRCVFSTDGGITNYVRLVTEDGEVIGDVLVEVGIIVGNKVCISGVEEGQFCDSGYKAIVEG